MKEMDVAGKPYSIIRLLGHGKGGYSYLVESEGENFVLKQIHHEPCSYYSFGNKIEAELNDYGRLMKAGIRVPLLIATDIEKERILKQYINGPTIFELVRDRCNVDQYLNQVRLMADKAKSSNLNIDYFPTNFVAQDGLVWYVDYECNDYMEQWSFENWGVRYWSRTSEFEAYLESLKQQEKVIASASS